MSKDVAFVCIPGGLCPSGYFDKTIAEFQRQGYHAIAVDHPSLDRRPEGPAGLEDDAENTRKQVQGLADKGLDVILVGNSYGGWVMTEAAKGISKTERAAEGKHGGVVHLVYLASGLAPESGISVTELFKGQVSVPQDSDEEGYIQPPPPELAGAMLAPSVSKEEQLRYGAMLKPMSDRVHHDKITYLGFEHVPTTVVITTNDAVVPPKWQFEGYDAAVAKGKGQLRKVELAADHCCMISHPVEQSRYVSKQRHYEALGSLQDLPCS